jgi:hypothetical protein
MRSVPGHCIQETPLKVVRCLERAEEAVVVSVRPDPEPHCHVLFDECNCPPVESDADRVDGLAWVDLAKVESRMLRISKSQLVGLCCSLSYV